MGVNCVNVLEKWRRKCLWRYRGKCIEMCWRNVERWVWIVWLCWRNEEESVYELCESVFLLSMSFPTAPAVAKFVRHYWRLKSSVNHHLVTAQAVAKFGTDFWNESTIFFIFLTDFQAFVTAWAVENLLRGWAFTKYFKNLSENLSFLVVK
jgi:hypothetical protein